MAGAQRCVLRQSTIQVNKLIYFDIQISEGYSANHVYCRRPGPGQVLNKRYREPTHESKQETDYSDVQSSITFLFVNRF